MHPTFQYGDYLIKRMDFDELNSVLNLQMANFQIIQVPLYHRNTQHFLGMAERSFYLAFKRHDNDLYALDRNNYLSKWSMTTGQLLSRNLVTTGDYSKYQVDRDLYDRNWFPFTLLHKA